MTKVYGLRQLIIDKYGEARFTLGCEIVARFVGFQSTYKWTSEKINALCNTTRNKAKISVADGQRFKQLFGIDSIDQLFIQTNK